MRLLLCFIIIIFIKSFFALSLSHGKSNFLISALLNSIINLFLLKFFLFHSYSLDVAADKWGVGGRGFI